MIQIQLNRRRSQLVDSFLRIENLVFATSMEDKKIYYLESWGGREEEEETSKEYEEKCQDSGSSKGTNFYDGMKLN